MSRPNKATVNLQALRHNLAHAKSLAPGARTMCVVKANAYGHGTCTIGQALDPLTDALAVACIEEALELRQHGVASPILLLEGWFEPGELVTAAQHNFWVMIDNAQQLQWLEQANLPAPVTCWLKVDTGMHRLGAPAEQAARFHTRLMACDNARNEVVTCTHFACADDLDSPMTDQQLALFDAVCAPLDGARSAANSAGVLAWPRSHYDWIRPGYMLYGNSPLPASHTSADALDPVMTLTSAVISLRDIPAGDTVGYGATWTAQRPSKIATVCIGYGDGYPRMAASGTPVLINGQRAPLAGRVSMDMITIDVTELDRVNLGDEAVLWGQGLPVDEVASHAGTSGYELLTRMPARTPRVISA